VGAAARPEPCQAAGRGEQKGDEMMKIGGLVLTVCCAVLLQAQSWAEPRRIDPYGEKVILRIGNMWSNQDTSLQLSGDSGLGAAVDLEDFFGLEEEVSYVMQGTVVGRFKERHRIGLQHYRFNRDSSSTLRQNWEGDDLTVEAGADSETTLNISITDLSYKYSFIRDNKHELAGSIGLFWMGLEVDIEFSGSVTGSDGVQTGSGTADGGLQAPLPVFGLDYSYAATSRWLTTVAIQYFALRTSVISGSLVKVSADTRYYFWDRFEVGGGLTVFDLAVNVDTNDLDGRVDWSFWGPQLFLGWRF
jgi:hypothetical protein